MNRLQRYAAYTTLAVATAMFVASGAMATEGNFLNGTGARNKGTAGAGVADSRDATAISINPAGLAELTDDEITLALSLFNPNRGVTVTGGPGFLPDGTTESGSDVFPLPNVAAAFKVGERGTVGFSVSGIGGQNTNYAPVANPACASPPFPASNGVFCGGRAGVNLIQVLVSAGYAHDFGPVKVGVAPIFAIQRFRGRGVLAFGGVSSNPGALSDNGQSISTGFGARIGIQVEPAEGFRIGASYRTEFDMTKFDEYAGLFENGGDFDLPSEFQVGVAADVTPDVTVMADYRHINYSDVPAISNPSSIPLPFGSQGGPGFGWNDVSSYKAGVEYRASGQTALRAGYSYNTQPVNGADVTLNVLAPGVTQHHFTAGGSFALGDRSTLELALMHSPDERVSGIEVTPLGPNPGRTVEVEMNQWEFTVGWKLKL